MSIKEFIQSQIESLDELRALLFFRAHPETAHGSDEIAGKLYLLPASAAQVLARLAVKGFLVVDGGPARYRFQPQTPELAALITELAALDQERPVTLIKLIYDRPKDIQAFADAFKIKKAT